MRKSLLLGLVMVLAGTASVEAGIFFGRGGGGCPNGTCGKSSYYGSGGYATTARPATVAATRAQTPQASEQSAVASAPETTQETTTAEAPQVRPSYQSSTRNASTARGRIWRRWAR